MSPSLPTSVAAPETPTVTAEQLDLIRRTVAQGATADELKLYLFDCARQGVHPLDKLIYFTKRAGRYTPITSIDFMRIRASETGEYAGSDDYVFSGEPKKEGFKAVAQVWRLVQGQRVPFTRTARWEEYVPPAGQNHMWLKMPHVMLGKVAEALALRVGFPKQLAGLYAKEEMDQAGQTTANGSGGSYTVESTLPTTDGTLKTPAHAPQHGGVFIVRVDVTETRNQNVKRYLVTDSNGEQYTTIKRQLGELCVQLVQDEPKPEVKIEWKASPYGQDLVSVNRLDMSTGKPSEPQTLAGTMAKALWERQHGRQTPDTKIERDERALMDMREPGDEESVF